MHIQVQKIIQNEPFFRNRNFQMHIPVQKNSRNFVFFLKTNSPKTHIKSASKKRKWRDISKNPYPSAENVGFFFNNFSKNSEKHNFKMHIPVQKIHEN